MGRAKPGAKRPASGLDLARCEKQRAKYARRRLRTLRLTKLWENDEERVREFGLPTSTFLQETFPAKHVTRKIFLIYSQGAWRIAYFEDDRELMEEVLDSPAMRGTTQRLLGVDVPRKRRRTPDTMDYYGEPRGSARNPRMW